MRRKTLKEKAIEVTQAAQINEEIELEPGDRIVIVTEEQERLEEARTDPAANPSLIPARITSPLIRNVGIDIKRDIQYIGFNATSGRSGELIIQFGHNTDVDIPADQIESMGVFRMRSNREGFFLFIKLTNDETETYLQAYKDSEWGVSK